MEIVTPNLGAKITGPTADLNLGIHLHIDGTPTEAVQLDTTEPATHSIDYVVIDTARLTSTSTRTVIVSASVNDNPQPQGAEQSSHDDNQATSTPPPANDNSPLIPVAATRTPSRPRLIQNP